MDERHDQPGTTPPTVPTETPQLRPHRPSQWPIVIGVIGVIFGAFGAVGGCAGIASPWFIWAMVKALPQEQAMGMTAMAQWRYWMAASSVPALGLGVLLLLGGVSLMRRRPRGRTMCMIWAVLRMPVVVFGLVIGYLMQQEHLMAMQEAFASDPTVPARLATTMGTFMRVVSLFGTVIGLAWGWALPVFMLIWFSRAKIKAEVASWGETEGHGGFETRRATEGHGESTEGGMG